MNRFTLSVAIVAVFLTCGAISQAGTYTVQEGLSPDVSYLTEKARIRSDDPDDTSASLLVGTLAANGGELRGLIKFDLTPLVAGIGSNAIIGASMETWLTKAGGMPRVDGTPKIDVYLYAFDIVENMSSWEDPDGDGNIATGDTTPGGTIGTYLGTFGEFIAPALYGPHSTGSTSAFITAVNNALAGDKQLRLMLIEDVDDFTTRDLAFFSADTANSIPFPPQITIQTVPEPSSALLGMCIGLLSFVGFRRRA